MNYPVWEIPYLGGASLIALIATAHVVLAHLAVGGSLFLVLMERKATRDRDPRILAYLRQHARLFFFITLVPGALSGVGIWFSIGLVSPWATSSLIHIFVWAWATEWALFLLEIVAALIYYYGWDRLSQPIHLRVGWIYFVAAWGSLAVVNGILTFMLTPGDWLRTRSMRDAFFNPGMLPSLFLRTLVCLALAGLFGLVTASRLRPPDLRRVMVKASARWLLPSFLLLPVGAVWLLARIPEGARRIALGGAPVVLILLFASVVTSMVLFLFAWLGPYRDPASLTTVYALLFVALGFFATATTEWAREAVRKPYLLYGYMYSNGFLEEEDLKFREGGILDKARFVLPTGADPVARGREVFRLVCEPCHTIHGYNGVAPLVRGWSADYTEGQLRHLNTLKGFMPPFIGSEVERRSLALWLAALNSGSPGGGGTGTNP